MTRSIKLISIRKHCPSLLLGSSPRTWKSCCRYDNVCRGVCFPASGKGGGVNDDGDVDMHYLELATMTFVGERRLSAPLRVAAKTSNRSFAAVDLPRVDAQVTDDPERQLHAEEGD